MARAMHSCRAARLHLKPWLKVASTPGTAFIMQLQAEVINATLEVPLLVAPCYAGSILTDGARCNACPDGNTYPQTASGPCTACPVDATCVDGMVVPETGSWSPHPLSSNIHKCPNPLACVHTLGPREVVSTG
jgi:hypothetical protein